MDRSFETLLLDRPAEGVVRIELNRPERRNAIDVRMALELDEALHALEGDAAARVVLIAAKGSVFSSGHDLDRTSGLDAEWEARRATSEGRFMVEDELYYRKGLYLRDYPKPTIAVVQGAAVAAGWTLASLCDLVLAGRSARFQNPMCRMGTAGPFLLVEPWDLNVRKAKELLFTGDWLSAEDARALGFVNQVHEDGALPEEALRLARRIALMPPWALRLVKRSLNHVLDEMGQRRSWEYQFLARQLGHASDERAQILSRLRAQGSVRGFLDSRDERFRDAAKSNSDLDKEPK